jgi:predicted amidophosphoribosyltransferase
VFRELQFGSCCVYSPQGDCEISVRSRIARALLKAGDPAYLSEVARIVKVRAQGGCLLSRLFEYRPVLIPVPGAAPGSSQSPWIAERLCVELLKQGLGKSIWPGLRRAVAVNKSGTAPAARRPSAVAHYHSFVVDADQEFHDKILLIDDIVTKGRTLLAAATRVREAFPQSEIEAFAFVRTMGLIPEILRLIDPCLGRIRWAHGDAHRSP